MKPPRTLAFVSLLASCGGAPIAARAANAHATDGAACIAVASLDREHASVGEQVLYRVRILSRNDVTDVRWNDGPRFPGFRAEWLPDRVQSEKALRDGTHYAVREERRALFPLRSGSLSITPPDLRCRIVTPDGDRAESSSVSGVTLRAVEPPQDGRPEGYDGVIGPVSLQTVVTPRSLRLGDTVRVAVMVRGRGNLWDIDDPLSPPSNVDVFQRRPEQKLEAGDHLVVIRHFAYDLVPLREGTLVVPALRVPFYDPGAGAFGVARSEAVSVEVVARAAAPAAHITSNATAAPTPADTAIVPGPMPRLRGTAAAAVLFLGALLGFARWWRIRRRRPALGAARAAAGRGDATEVARWLRAGITHYLPEAHALTAEEIAEHPKLPRRAREAARLLVEADSARFDRSTSSPDPDAVRRALAAL